MLDVKHRLDQSASSLMSLKTPVNLQALSAPNKVTAIDMKVDLLTLGVGHLESTSELSHAIFAEERNGWINVE